MITYLKVMWGYHGTKKGDKHNDTKELNLKEFVYIGESLGKKSFDCTIRPIPLIWKFWVTQVMMYNSAIVRRRPLQVGTHPDVGMDLCKCTPLPGC